MNDKGLALLSRQRELLLAKKENIQQEKIYAEVPVFSERGCIGLLGQILQRWSEDIYINGRRILPLHQYITYQGSVFRTGVHIMWIYRDSGEVVVEKIDRNAVDTLPGYDEPSSRLLKAMAQTTRVFVAGRFPEPGTRTLFMSLQQLIAELKQEVPSVKEQLRVLHKRGQSLLEKQLRRSGFDAVAFPIKLFCRGSEDVRIICRIAVPNREVRAHLGSTEPLINKSQVAKRMIMKEVEQISQPHLAYCLVEEDYQFYFERSFTFGEADQIMGKVHLQQLTEVATLLESALI
ncbi:MAG: hypothetical protein ACLFQ0_21225 [Cyclobacteriaceae bacterium]